MTELQSFNSWTNVCRRFYYCVQKQSAIVTMEKSFWKFCKFQSKTPGALGALLIKTLWQSHFPVNFAKLPRELFLQKNVYALFQNCLKVVIQQYNLPTIWNVWNSLANLGESYSKIIRNLNIYCLWS